MLLAAGRRALQAPCRTCPVAAAKRFFSCTMSRSEIRDINVLPDRVVPVYEDDRKQEFLTLRWPMPPRNILVVRKEGIPEVTSSVIEFAKHIKNNYTPIHFIFEPSVASEIHTRFDFPVYTTTCRSHSSTSVSSGEQAGGTLRDKVDLTATFGGDGTILHASSLFANVLSVPPILTFCMGTLGFLGEWKFNEYKRAFREVYMSGAGLGDPRAAITDDARVDNRLHTVQADASSDLSSTSENPSLLRSCPPSDWSSIRGKSYGSSHGAHVLLRQRLKVGVFSATGDRIGIAVNGYASPTSPRFTSDVHAMNEVNIHRGRDPHLAVVEVYVGGRFLTEAVADGMIVSTPTGSTAYSLSSGGSIVHPLVSSLLLTPICPRSLSFRPLVLPANTLITLRLSEKNRAKQVEVSIDGVSQANGLRVGMELRVSGEEIEKNGLRWRGGVPCIVRGGKNADAGGDDAWVGGLNGLLKFNYPFGEEH